MSSLTEREKRCFEKLFNMESGKVYDYDNQSYVLLFKKHGINIYDEKYTIHGTCPVNTIRNFWAEDPDRIVGDVLSEMLDSCEADFNEDSPAESADRVLLDVWEMARFMENYEAGRRTLKECRNIVERLYENIIPSTEILINYAKSRDFNKLLDQIHLLNEAIESNSRLAIGKAKELLETVCKTILEDYNIEYGNKQDLPQLTKTVSEKLGLLPNNIPDTKKGSETIRLILNSLAQVIKGVAQLRNLYAGHGRSARQQGGLQPRHARESLKKSGSDISRLFTSPVATGSLKCQITAKGTCSEVP